MKKFMFAVSVCLFTSAVFAQSEEVTIETKEVKSFSSHKEATSSLGLKSLDHSQANVGEIIAVAKEIVALGEQVYELVQKGKPTVTTDFAPISVVPKDSLTKEPVDPMEMENCAFPQNKKFVTSVKTGDMEVARFEYVVVFTYGCSYNGKGKFIQNAMVVPASVRMGYGWDFNATMKLTGLMNHGSKDQPNVGALLTIKYSMNSWRRAIEKNDTIHITGAGQLKAQSM